MTAERFAQLGAAAGYMAEADEKMQQEISFLERVGYTLNGIPFNSTQLGRLSSEDKGWVPFSGSGDYDPYSNRVQVDQYLGDTWHRDPIARNIVNNYVYFVHGGGFAFNFESDARAEEFEEWAEESGFDPFQERIIREQTLFGYGLALLFPLTSLEELSGAGKMRDSLDPDATVQERNQVERRAKRRQLEVKNLIKRGEYPEDVAECLAREAKKGKTLKEDEALVDSLTAPREDAEGFRYVPDCRVANIIRDPADWTRVLAYEIEGFDDLVAARDVIDFSNETIGTGVRGTSVLSPVLRELVYARKWSEDRWYLNHTRARVPIIRKAAKTSTGRNAQGSALQSLPSPGHILQDNSEYQFPEMKIDSGGVKDDFRHLILRIAAGVSLPEFLVLQDASNNNYASILVAESPAHNLFRKRQRYFKRKFEQLLALFGWGDAEVEPPPVVPKDLLNDTKAYSMQLGEGLISRQTASERLGNKWQEEQERMAADDNNVGAPAAVGLPFPDDGDGED